MTKVPSLAATHITQAPILLQQSMKSCVLFTHDGAQLRICPAPCFISIIRQHFHNMLSIAMAVGVKDCVSHHSSASKHVAIISFLL